MKKTLIFLTIFMLTASAFADISLNSAPVRQTGKTNHSFLTRDILFEQLANVSAEGGISSQDFEASFDAYDAEGADEFVVPVGETWTIDQVVILGTGPTGPIVLANIRFYEDNAGVPGTMLFEYLDVVSIPGADADLDCTIPATVFTEGTYWLGVQGDIEYALYGQWFWTKQAAPTIGYEFYWRNPLDGFVTGCTTWTTGSIAYPGYVDYNLSFGLYGTSGGGPSYPISYGNSNSYEWITNVTLTDINNTTGPDAGGYGDYTALVADVTVGQTYDLSSTIEYDSNDYLTAWIDWNHDYDFSDAGEEYILAAGVSANGPFIVPVTVPTTRYIGETRMRVSLKWAAAPLPDEVFSYGEVEDYTVNIIDAPTVYTLPFAENFEGGVIPTDWTMTTNSIGWFVTLDGSSTYWTIPTGDGYYACSNDDAAGSAGDGSMDYLTTPEFDLTGVTGTTLTFDSYYDGNYGQIATVEASTDGTTWTIVNTLTPSVSGVWDPIVVDLSAYDGFSSVWFAFHSDDAATWASGWACDNVSIDEAPGPVGEYVLNTVLDGGNPGGLNTDTDSGTTGWVEVAPASQSVNIWTAGTLPADFDFLFYNQPVSDYKVSLNGLFTFDVAAADPPPDVNVNLPDATCPDKTIAAFWDEFTLTPPTGSNDRVYTKTFGTAPNRQVWFKYHSFEYSTYSYAYFGFCLEETTNRVYIVDYNYKSGGPGGATIGLQYDATTAIEQPDSPNYEFLAGSSGNADNDYYEFIPLIPGAPGYPENPVPASGSTGIAGAGDLMWDFGIDTDTYDLWFGPAGAMTEVVTGAAAGATGSYAYSGLAFASGYEWQVICHNAVADLTTNGSVWNFTVMNDPVFAQVGDGVTTNMSLPMEPFYGYSWSNSIYLASEIMTGGDITGIQYQYQSTGGFGPDDIVVYIGHTTQTEFIDGDDWIDVTTMTEVYNGPFSISAGAGDWVGITFPVPFAYNGTDNLVIGFDENTQGYHSSSDEFLCTDTTPIRGIVYYNDSTNPDPLTPPTANQVRNAFPNVRLNGLVQPNGTLSGYVYEFGTTNPIENAEVTCAGEVDYTDATGFYEIPGILIGTYDATADHADYFPETISVDIFDGVVTTQDFGLEWSEILVSPSSFTVYLDPDVTTDEILTITNNGPHDLTYTAGLNFISDYTYEPVITKRTTPVNSAYNENDVVQRERDIPVINSDAIFDLQFQYATGVSTGEAGVETDGNFIYTPLWNGTDYCRYAMDGTFIETFTVTGTAGVRDLAWDGTYFYGAAANTSLYQMDFTQGAEVLVSTITAPVACRGIAYDNAANGFWANNWSTDITLFDMTGTVLNSFPCQTAISFYGFAYDDFLAGGPYLWGFSQSPANTLVQFDIATGLETGVFFDVGALVGSPAGSAGGMFISDACVPGTATIGCMIQNEWIVGLELCVTETWLTLTNNASGVVPPGGFLDVTVHFDATGFIAGDIKTGEIIVNSDAVTGQEIVPASMNVGGAAPDAGYVMNPVLDGGNPGGLNGDSDSSTTGWIEILPPSQSVNIWSAIQTLPTDFDFLFFNEPVTEFKVSLNGLLTFDVAAADPPPDVNVNLPDATCPDKTIVAFWDEFTLIPPTGSNDRVYTKTFGTAPNRQIWFKYHSFEYGGYSFAYWGMALEETTNRIYLVDMNYSSAVGAGSSTIGLQYDAATAIEHPDSPNFAFLAGGSSNADNDYYEFIPLIPGAPGYPENPVPASGATGIAGAGDLMWDFGIDTDTYDLWLGPAGAMVEVVTGAAAGATGTYAFSGLAFSTTYEWQVICHNAVADLTTNGSVWNFTTMNDPIYSQIGDGVTVNMSLPIEPFYGYSWSNSIYLASEIMTGGDITGIQYQYQSTGGFGPDDIIVYIGHTTQTEFIDGDDWIDVTTMTEVYNGPFSITPGAGNWVGITFPVPFTYNGTDNLVIGFDENTQGYHSSTDEFLCTDTTPIRGICYYNDSTNPDPFATLPTANAVRNAFPNVRLNGLVQPNGTLSGYVYEFGTTNPIENAEVTCTGEVDYTDATGFYEIPGILIGTYDATADHAAYFPETISVDIFDGVVTTQDFGLEWSEILVSPTSFTVYLDPDVTTDEILTITNNGIHDLTYNCGLNFISDYTYEPVITKRATPVNLAYNENDVVHSERKIPAINSDAIFDLQFQYATGVSTGEAGVETDGNFIYTPLWNGTDYCRYAMDGTFIETFSVTGTSGVRDLAWDGTYFYGAAASTSLYQMDFTQGAEVLVSTITAPVACRAIAYDNAANGFWANNWSTDITLFDMTGTILNSFPCQTAISFYGFAYDDFLAGGPYLWGFSQSPANTLVQFDIATGLETGVFFDVGALVGSPTGSAGGMFISDACVPGTATLGCMIQNEWIVGLELCPTETWLTLTNNASGVVPPGGFLDVTVHFDATGYVAGEVKTGEIIVNSDAVTGQEIVPATMNVGGVPVPAVIFSDYIEGSSNNKALAIWNNTGDVINLDEFRIAQSVNGGGWAYWHIFPVGATVVDQDVWVMLNSSTDPTLFDFANADEILSYPSVVHHNGDDARGLEWTSDGGATWILIDVIGVPTEDPGDGWDVAGVVDGTKDHTLYRKNAIMTGNTDWAASAGTNAGDSEWIVYPQNTFTYLGQHPYVSPFAPPENVMVDEVTALVTWDAPPLIISEDNFDSYTPGDYLGIVNPTMWTTWSNAPGTGEDVVVSNAQSSSPDNSILVETNNDCVMIMNDYTSGVYSLAMDMYVPTGFGGYFNLQKTSVPGTEWAFQIAFNDDGSAVVDAGGAAALTFTYTPDTWMSMKLEVDLNTDWCDFYFDDTLMIGYQWTLGTFGTPGLLQFGGMNIFGGGCTGTPMFYFDNVVLKELVPATDALTGYNVYLDGALQGYTTDLEYPLDTTILTSGNTYTAGVSAVYDDPGESDIVDYVFTYLPTPLDPPQNLFVDNLGYATWDAPGGGAGDILLDQQPNQVNGIFSDASWPQVCAESFVLAADATIEQLVVWGGYYSANVPMDPDYFTVIFHDDAAGLPGNTLFTEVDVPYARVQTGIQLFGVDEWMHTLTLATPVTLAAGTYWIEFYNTTGYPTTDTYFWETGNLDPVNGILGQAWSTTSPGSAWTFDGATDMALQLISSADNDLLAKNPVKINSSNSIIQKGVVSSIGTQAKMISDFSLEPNITHRIKTNTSLMRDFIGYNVYLDGAFAFFTTDLFYQYLGLVTGQTYLAEVTALYDEGESAPIDYTFTYEPTPLLPPQNLAVTDQGYATWEAPGGGGGVSLFEDFSSGVFPPADWVVYGLGAGNWSESATNNAGGTAPEAMFGWSPSFTGATYFTTPVLATSGMTELDLVYSHFLNDYSSTGYSIGVATTSDGGVTWNTAYEVFPTGDIGPEVVSVTVATADVGSDNFQLAFFFNGYSFDLDYYYIDDISLEGTSGGSGTVQVDPMAVPYWTGTTNGTTLTDDSEVRGCDTEDGWMMFDVSGIPDGSTITDIQFNGYVNATYYPYWEINGVYVDPLTTDPATLFAAITNSANQYNYFAESSTFPTGWKVDILGGTANADLAAALATDWFCLGINSTDDYVTYFINFDGWNEAYPPFLNVTYEGTDGTVATTKVKAGGNDNSRDHLGYNVYLDTVFEVFTTDEFYQYTGLTVGVEYDAAVTALYDEGESDPAEYTFTYNLDNPIIVVDPMVIIESLDPDEILTVSMSIENIGTGNLTFDISVVELTDEMGRSRRPENNSRNNSAIHDPANTETDPNWEKIDYPPNATDALFDLQFQYPTGVSTGEAGVETDGNFIYTPLWNGTLYCRYAMDGTFIETFAVAGTGAVRDLAYDGQYFYGAAANTSLFQMDFTPGAEVLVSTITAPVACRAIAYDDGAVGFWANNWSTDITLFDMSGTVLNSFPCQTAISFYGFAYDNFSAGGPFLWGFSQSPQNTLIQFDIATGLETGVTCDVGALVGTTVGIAGGMFIADGFVPGFVTIGCMIQNETIVGLELCPGDEPWLSVDPISGVVAAGTSEPVDVILNATDLINIIKTGELHIANNAGVDVIVPVTMEVIDPVNPFNPPENVEVDPYTAIVTWEPPGGTIYGDDFESYTVGEYLAVQSDDWTTWSNNPGSAEDALISDDYAFSGTNSVKVDGTTDLVLIMDNYTTGAYSIALNMYIPTGYCGYYNLQKTNVPGTEWGFQIQFDVTGIASIDGGAAAACTFPFDFDTWMNFEIVVDMDNDLCEFFYDGTLMHSYQWTLGTFGTPGLNQLGGVNMYAWASAGNNPLYYFDDFNVSLVNAEPSEDVIGYNVWLDDMITPLTYTTELQCALLDHITLNYGQDYIAGVSAVYDDPEGESDIEQVPFTFTQEPINPPENLVATVFDYNDVHLEWEPPSGAGGGILAHHSGYIDNGIGTGAAADFMCAARFDAADLVDYYGSDLTSVNVHIRTADFSYVAVKVWEGGSFGNPGTEVYSADITGSVLIEDWTEHTLTTPIPLVDGNEYWIGYDMSATGDHPASVDAGPAVPGKGDWMYYTGAWIEISVAYALDFNWCIEGVVGGGDEILMTTRVTQNNHAPRLRNMMSSGIPEALFNHSHRARRIDNNRDSRMLEGYKVYRDGVEIFEIFDPNELTYDDLGLDEGTYEYYVTAIYDNGESDPSNVEEVIIVLNPPQDFNAIVQGMNNVFTSWDAPATRELVSYNIYRNDVVVGNVTSTFYLDVGVPSGDHTYYATAIYNVDWESDPSNSVTVTVDVGGIPLPLVTELNGNYPNPFNPDTRIKFSVHEAGNVRIDIFNSKGQKIRTLVNEYLSANFYNMVWDGKDTNGLNVSSGVYFYKMDAGKYTSTKKMILMK